MVVTSIDLCFVPCRRTQSVGHEPLRRQGSSTTSRPPQPLSAQAIKHIWVRTALFEKVLDNIVQYIVDNSRWFDLFFTPKAQQWLTALHSRFHCSWMMNSPLYYLFSVPFSSCVRSLVALFFPLSGKQPLCASKSCPHSVCQLSEMMHCHFTDQSLKWRKNHRKTWVV